MLTTNMFHAPPAQPATQQSRIGKMKVKCLDSGSQAHLDSAKVFEYKEGENIDGLSEETAISMRDAGH